MGSCMLFVIVVLLLVLSACLHFSITLKRKFKPRTSLRDALNIIALGGQGEGA